MSKSPKSNEDDENREVTQGALEIWLSLPEKIKQDPSLASFRHEHERRQHLFDDIHSDDAEDPLPTEDILLNESSSACVTPINQRRNNHQDHQQQNHENNDITLNIEGNEQGQQIMFKNKLDNNSEKNANIDGIGDGHHATATTSAGGGAIDEAEPSNDSRPKKMLHIVKIVLLLIVWASFTTFLMMNSEIVIEPRQLSVPTGFVPKDLYLETLPKNPRIGVQVKGAFDGNADGETHNDGIITNHNPVNKYLYIFIQLLHLNSGHLDTDKIDAITHTENITTVWKIPLFDVRMWDSATLTKKSHVFDFGEIFLEKVQNKNAKFRIRLKTSLDKDDKNHLPIQISVNDSPIDKTTGVIYAAFVLLGLYILIIWEIVHRTFAAMIASTMAIGILAAMNERPTMSKIISWIDVETLLLLFGMMILVAILSETGFFDYLAVYAYKITSGRIWPLINCLCFFTAILSSFLDNVTTVLLMTPVSIRLCEVMGLNPVPILMCMIIYSNIGGALTPVGDPPNVIIASNSFIAKSGVTFSIFTLHMALGVLLVGVQTYFQLRYKFRNTNDLRFSEPQDVQEMRHEISVWQRAAASLSSYSKDEDLVRETLIKKVNRLKRSLKKKQTSGSTLISNYEQTLEVLTAKYPIRSKPLLIKSGIALFFVISFFFLHSMPDLQKLSLGWTAILGAILLLILADKEDMEAILARVEWSTLLFFAALFVLMESLSELGLIDWIGKQTEYLIWSVNKESRLAVAILLILWVSAIASAFVDNIPLTTMMVKIAISLSENKELDLPLQPLVWALAFGACLGGNGTLIGASANVVCAGVAEQHGYRFTFIEYFKIGFPVMICSIVVATVYLMIVHVVFQWH